MNMNTGRIVPAALVCATLVAFFAACDAAVPEATPAPVPAPSWPSDITGTKWSGLDANDTGYTVVFLEDAVFYPSIMDSSGSGWSGGDIAWTWNASSGRGTTAATNGDWSRNFSMASSGASISIEIEDSSSTVTNVTLAKQTPFSGDTDSLVGCEWEGEDANGDTVHFSVYSDTGGLIVVDGVDALTYNDGRISYSTADNSGTISYDYVSGTPQKTTSFTIDPSTRRMVTDTAIHGLTQFKLKVIFSDY